MSRFDDFLNEDFDGEQPDADSRALLRRLAELEDPAPPADLTDRVMARVRSEQRPQKSAALPLIKRWAPVAAAVLLVLAAIPFLLGHFGPQPPELADGPAGPGDTPPETVAVTPESPDPIDSQKKDPVEVAVVTPPVSPGHYAPPEKVDAYFETWDQDLAEEMEAYSAHASETASLEVASLPADTYGYYESPYEDPLSALVGF